MRCNASPARLVYVVSECSGLRDAECYSEDNCRDDMCTETIVLNIAAAIDATTAACVDVKGMISPSLGNQIAGVVIVRPSYRPNLMRSTHVLPVDRKLSPSWTSTNHLAMATVEIFPFTLRST